MSVRPHSSGGCRCGSLALAAIMVAALIAFFLPVPVASAESPFRVGSQIEDRASVLGDRTGEVEAAMKELQKNASLQLWMVYVDTFSGTSATDWAGQTAERSDLGLRDILIAVAVEDRAYAYSVDQDFPLTDAELNDVMTTSVEPALTEDDWAGAAVGAAAGLEQASSGVPVAPAGQPTGSESSGGSYLVVWVVLLAILAFIGFFVVRGLRRASRARGTPAASSGGPGADEVQAALPLDDLRKQANLQLVETDDAIKTSEEELGFAIAEFGEAAAAPFEKALDEARRDLSKAFELRRELDDATDESTQRRLLSTILQQTAKANERLDAEAERFDKLRDLEDNVPQTLAGLEERLIGLEARLPQASRTLEELAAVYAEAALSSATASPKEAKERIAFARELVGDAHTDLGAGRQGEAVVTALAAEEAAGQAQRLLDAVERLREDLDAAAATISETIAETQRDIAEAQALGGQAQLAPLVATARAAVDAAAAAAAPPGGRDPLAALLRLRESDDALERALQKVRDARTQQAKAAASLHRALLAARSETSSAADYVTTHRGAIGSGPRTRLAEAQQNLQEALALGETDPATAAQHAARAQELAGRALVEAQAEVTRAQAATYPQATGRTGGGMGGFAGAVIGGILINTVLGGGGFGGGGRRGGGGGFGPASFGGGGTRMRRGGGGRF